MLILCQAPSWEPNSYIWLGGALIINSGFSLFHVRKIYWQLYTTYVSLGNVLLDFVVDS